MQARGLVLGCSGLIWLITAYASSPASAAKDAKDESRFCVRERGHWLVTAYPPLIDTQAGTDVTEFVLTDHGSRVSHVLVKHYTSRYELMFDSKFDEAGHLSALHGLLRRWGRWMAEADLFPEPDGMVPEPDVSYRMRQDGGIIATPEDGSDFVGHFREVKVYRTVREVPCAAEAHLPAAS